MPYLQHVNGFAYNVDMIRARMPDAPVDSLDMIFKPEIIARFADCGVSFLDSAEDVLQLALNYLHLDPNTTRPEDYSGPRSCCWRAPVYPHFRFLGVHERTCQRRVLHLHVLVGGLRDLARARQAAGVDVHLAFTVPKEGANASFDALLIPADAPHPRRRTSFSTTSRAAGDRRGDQRHPLWQRQPGRRSLRRPADPHDPAVYPTPAGRGAAVLHARKRAGTRAAAHAHLDAHQDRSVGRGCRVSARRAAFPARGAGRCAHELAGDDDADARPRR